MFENICQKIFYEDNEKRIIIFCRLSVMMARYSLICWLQVSLVWNSCILSPNYIQWTVKAVDVITVKLPLFPNVISYFKRKFLTCTGIRTLDLHFSSLEIYHLSYPGSVASIHFNISLETRIPLSRPCGLWHNLPSVIKL